MTLICPFKGIVNGSTQVSKSSFYLYEIKNHLDTCTGLICSVPLTEVLNGKILKHEAILPEKAAFLYNNFLEAKIQYNPILLITNDIKFEQKITKFSAQTKLLGKHDAPSGVEHRLMHLPPQAPFKLSSSLYIADGHHRLSALLKYHQNTEGKRMMVAIFSAAQMKTRSKSVIIRYEISKKAFFWQRLNFFFDIRMTPDPKVPDTPIAFLMYFNQKWFFINLKSEFYESVFKDFLAIDIFKKIVLNAIFSIFSYSFNDSVDIFFDSCNITAVESHIQDKDWIGFVIASDPFDKIMKGAQKGRLLEPKSTYFEPKILSGVISQHLEDA